MEVTIKTELGIRADGTRICRYRLVNPAKENIMAQAHSYFTKEEKTIAKYNHKHKKYNN
jgi:hypothetical protein